MCVRPLLLLALDVRKCKQFGGPNGLPDVLWDSLDRHLQTLAGRAQPGVPQGPVVGGGGGSAFSAGKRMPCGRRLSCIIWYIRSGNLSKFPFSCRQAGHPQALGPKNRAHIFPPLPLWHEMVGSRDMRVGRWLRPLCPH